MGQGVKGAPRHEATHVIKHSIDSHASRATAVATSVASTRGALPCVAPRHGKRLAMTPADLASASRREATARTLTLVVERIDR